MNKIAFSILLVMCILMHLFLLIFLSDILDSFTYFYKLSAPVAIAFVCYAPLSFYALMHRNRRHQDKR